MVGRLVHQEHIGLSQENLGHGNPHLPSAGEMPDVAVDLIVLKPQPVQHLTRLGLESVAAQALIAVLHFAIAGQDSFHRIGVIRIGHVVLQRLEFVMQFSQLAASRYGLVQHAPTGHVIQFLAEIGDAELAGNGDGTFIRLFGAFDQPKQSGFAATVRPYQPGLLSGIDLKAEIGEHRFLKNPALHRVIIGLLLSAVIALLISPQLTTSTYTYQPGDISRDNIRAPRDFSIEDTLTTEKLRQEKKAAVLSVYDFNSRADDDIEKKVTTAFSVMREALPRAKKNEQFFSRGQGRVREDTAHPAAG